MMMPPAGSRPIDTSQNVRFVRTPSPSTCGQLTFAASVTSASCAGGRAGCPRRAWPAAADCIARTAASSTASRTYVAAPPVQRPASAQSRRCLLIDAGQSGCVRRRIHACRAMLDQLEELHAGAGVVTEDAQHSAGHRKRILLLDTAHGHAEMGAFTDDRDAARVDLLANRLRNLVGHPLLDLQPAGKHVDKAGNLAETDPPLARHVR